ncbi:MAG: PLP-dependent aminotransferase family protein, partial [Pseudomonadota bacterium]
EKSGIFFPSQPDITGFPFNIWARLIARSWRSSATHSPKSLLMNSDINGFYPLRKAISNYLNGARALKCNADQVMIVSGAQQAISLIAHLLLEEADIAVVEDPGFPGIRGALMGAGAQIIPVETDENGIHIDQLPSNAKIICTAPSNHYPLGGTTSATRRLELLNWGRVHHAWILEDDYDSEYRYFGRPLSALQGMDMDHQVIYFGSFSKVIFPSLRLGYLVLPQHLIQSFSRIRKILDSTTSIVAQPALSDFIDEGYFATHLRRTRNLYRQRLTHMQKEIEQYLDPQYARFSNPAAGMHACLRFDQCQCDLKISDQKIAALLNLQNIMAMPLSVFYVGDVKAKGLALGFAGTEKQQISYGIKKIAQIIETYQ